MLPVLPWKQQQPIFNINRWKKPWRKAFESGIELLIWPNGGKISEKWEAVSCSIGSFLAGLWNRKPCPFSRATTAPIVCTYPVILSKWLLFSICYWNSVFDIQYITQTFYFKGVLEWPFWTKLVVVAIGFTGGLVFMYVQCKVYVQLWRRLKAYNRVIFVQNCPDTIKKLEEKNSPCTQPSDVKDAVVVPVAQTGTNSQLAAEEATSEVMPVWHGQHRFFLAE